MTRTRGGVISKILSKKVMTVRKPTTKKIKGSQMELEWDELSTQMTPEDLDEWIPVVGRRLATAGGGGDSNKRPNDLQSTTSDVTARNWLLGGWSASSWVVDTQDVDRLP